MPKIYAVTIDGTDNPRLVRAHTRAGAERFVRDSIKPKVSADVASQEVIISAMRAGVEIESAIDSPQADIGDVPQVATFGTTAEVVARDEDSITVSGRDLS